MANFFAELKRRHIYRVAAAYVVVAWMILQAVNNLAPGLNLPTSAITLVIVMLAAGFPIALLFAWILHLASAEGSAKSKAGAPDWILTGALAIVIGIFAYQQFMSAPGARTAQASIASPASQPGGISIAVLPFTNLSDDRAQEFFSDGMTEEITTALAKVQGMTVIGRTSAFEFKGQNRDLRMIGESLGATHLIEGSVRKQGERVRISAQLIRADNGAHLWAENYDRELTDIFAIQEDIAQAIAAALKVPLGLQQGESLVNNRTQDLESYQQYLFARSQVRSRAIDKAIEILEPLVARDPNYAPAAALLAYAYFQLPNFTPAQRSGSIEEARAAQQAAASKGMAAARRATQLDPKNAFGYGTLGAIEFSGAKWADGDTHYAQALMLDPNDPELLHSYSNNLASSGRLKEALAIREKVRTLEPFVPVYNVFTAQIFQLNGQNVASISILEALPTDTSAGYYRNVFLSRAYAASGRFKEAADTLLFITSNQVTRQSVEQASRLLRQAPARGGKPQDLPKLDGELGFVYAYAGAPERMIEFGERAAQTGSAWAAALRLLWLPEAVPVRKSERFKKLVRAAGLVDYWRARGWPDLCRPMGADDFVCD